MYREQAMHRAMGRHKWAEVLALLSQEKEHPDMLASALVSDTVQTGVLILQRRTPTAIVERDAFQSQLEAYVDQFGDEDSRVSLQKHVSECKRSQSRR
jgi:hypothetical protein